MMMNMNDLDMRKKSKIIQVQIKSIDCCVLNAYGRDIDFNLGFVEKAAPMNR